MFATGQRRGAGTQPIPRHRAILAGTLWLALAAAALAQEKNPEPSETRRSAEPYAEVEPPTSSLYTNAEVSDPANATDEELLPTIPVATPAPEPLTPHRPNHAAHLDEIIVTATKREKSVREIPVTINAYSGQELTQRGATNLEEMVKLQPGTTKNGNRVVMRGIATSALGTYATSEEVGRFFGDVSLNAPSARGALADLDPFDMQTIEMAKGPQGTLFGGTALAGAVRFVPNAPDVSGFGAALRAGVGTVSHSDSPQWEAAVMVNGALDNQLGVRLVGSWRDRPGALDDLHNEHKDIDDRQLTQWRALGRWQPSDSFTVDATYLSWSEDQGDLGFTDRPDAHETRIHRLDQPSYMDASLASLRAQYRWEQVSLIGIASLLDSGWFDIVDLAPALGVEDLPVELPFPVDVAARAPSYELRIVSEQPSESGWWILRDWDYLAGLFLLRGHQKLASQIIVQLPLPIPLPLPVSPSVTALDQRGEADVEERAFFFDVTRSLADGKVEINLGGRVARSTVDALSYYVVAEQPVAPERNATRESRFNPKVALTWRPRADLSLYASAAQGFRFGGVNGNPTAGIDIPRTFKSDSLWNYEIGLRSDWFDRRLRFDVTAFRIDWTDLQITQINNTAQNFVSNVGGARVLGVEASTRWLLPELPLLPDGLSLSLAASYTDARTTEAFDSENGPVPPETRLPLTPYITAGGGIHWNGSTGGWLLAASLTDAYVGDRKNELINTVEMPSFHSVGALLSASHPELRFAPEISLSVTNLLDEEAVNFAVPATIGPNVLYVLNRPRTVLFSAQLRF